MTSIKEPQNSIPQTIKNTNNDVIKDTKHTNKIERKETHHQNIQINLKISKIENSYTFNPFKYLTGVKPHSCPTKN